MKLDTRQTDIGYSQINLDTKVLGECINFQDNTSFDKFSYMILKRHEYDHLCQIDNSTLFLIRFRRLFQRLWERKQSKGKRKLVPRVRVGCSKL